MGQWWEFSTQLLDLHYNSKVDQAPMQKEKSYKNMLLPSEKLAWYQLRKFRIFLIPVRVS